MGRVLKPNRLQIGVPTVLTGARLAMPQGALMSGPAVVDNLSPWTVLDDARETARFTTTATTSATLGGDAAIEATCFLRIAGMHCAACATVVEAALRRVDGVREVQVSVAAQTARVRWEIGRASCRERV